jgi:Tol biopolymer transport system component
MSGSLHTILRNTWHTYYNATIRKTSRQHNLALSLYPEGIAMPYKRIVGLLVALTLAAISGTSAAAQERDAEVALQRAMHVEQVEGDLEKAIQLYRQLVDEHGASRAVAARALVRIGQCYEKLGSEGAREAYDRVVREFADQPDAVAIARRRLETLATLATDVESVGAEETGVVLRQIEFEGSDTPWLRLSPDGEKIVYMHSQQAQPRFSIRVRDLSSGEVHVLVDSVGETNHFEWSPDGSQIAYRYQGRELRVMKASGGDSRLVWASPAEGAVVDVLDWTPDGHHLLAGVGDYGIRTARLLMVPISGGEPQLIVSGSFSELVEHGQISPSGRHVAGVLWSNGNADVHVWPVDGSEEVRITTHPATDDSPYWSPDGRFLVFRSDRAGEYDLWAVSMIGAEPGGPPFRVRAALGKRVLLTGMTLGGKLTMLTMGEGTPSDMFVMAVDPRSGEPYGQFRPFARYPIQSSSPRWSPKGDRIAYLSRKGEFGLPRTFISFGSHRDDIEVSLRGYFVGNIEWDRGAEHLIFPGVNQEDGQAGVYRVSLEDYAVEPLHLGGQVGRGYQGAFVNLHWLPVSRTFFLQQYIGSEHQHVYSMDGAGETLTRVVDSLPTTSYAWPSPNGQHVAYRKRYSLHVASIEDSQSRLLGEWTDTTWFDVSPGWSPDGRQIAWTDRTKLVVLDAQGSTERLLVEATENSQIVAPPAWSPDGTHIAYVVRDTVAGEVNRADEVWLIPSGGGSPWRVALAPNTHPRLKLSTWRADGTLCASGGQGAGTPGTTIGYQHWVLENFLPEGSEPEGR